MSFTDIRFQNVSQVFNFATSADLVTKQYLAVAVDADAKVNVAGAGAGFGILQNKPSGVGATAEVAATPGFTALWKVGAACAVNTLLKSDANGKGVAVASNNDFYLARALQTASADGDIIVVAIEKGYYGA